MDFQEYLLLIFSGPFLLPLSPRRLQHSAHEGWLPGWHFPHQMEKDPNLYFTSPSLVDRVLGKMKADGMRAILILYSDWVKFMKLLHLSICHCVHLPAMGDLLLQQDLSFHNINTITSQCHSLVLVEVIQVFLHARKQSMVSFYIRKWEQRQF